MVLEGLVYQRFVSHFNLGRGGGWGEGFWVGVMERYICNTFRSVRFIRYIIVLTPNSFPVNQNLLHLVYVKHRTST